MHQLTLVLPKSLLVYSVISSRLVIFEKSHNFTNPTKRRTQNSWILKKNTYVFQPYAIRLANRTGEVNVDRTATNVIQHAFDNSVICLRRSLIWTLFLKKDNLNNTVLYHLVIGRKADAHVRHVF